MNEQIANTVTAAVQSAGTSNNINISIDPNVLFMPISWIPAVQKFLLDFIFISGNLGLTIVKALVLLLPVLLVIVGLWITMASAYTILFRSGRIKFIVTMALSWWDILTSIWNYWVGSIRFVFLSAGWLWELVKITIVSLFVGLFRIIALPFKGASEMARRYSQGGVPWVAVTVTVVWSILEATIFTYTLLPTITEVLADVTGIENQALIVPFLFMFLFLLILGSFACLYVLIEAVKTKKVEAIIQMVLVELFVLFFEVVFLYRELVDALTPWIAQQSGDTMRLGMVSTLLLSAFLWAGIRGMTWFLFARFGTPTLIAVISRQKMEGDAPAETRKEILQETWENFIGVFKHNVDWFNDAGKKYMEAASLPVFQIIAAAVNITLVLFTSKTVFTIPFKSMEEVMNTKDLLGSIMKKKEQG
jgi:hypothetical protein